MREKMALAEGKADAAQKNVKKLRVSLKSCSATRVTTSRKLMGEIAGLKNKEKLAINAALTSSKIIDDATKQIIGSKYAEADLGSVDRLKANILGFMEEKNL
jgi:hypothetical protein